MDARGINAGIIAGIAKCPSALRMDRHVMVNAARKIIGSITRDKSVLEKKIDELRTFEREYRTRLKTYLESQLRDLEGRGTAAPAAESRAAANGGYAATGYGQRADAGS